MSLFHKVPTRSKVNIFIDRLRSVHGLSPWKPIRSQWVPIAGQEKEGTKEYAIEELFFAEFVDGDDKIDSAQILMQ